jgi:hypothetical protein
MSQKYTNNDIENFDKIFRRKSFFKKSKNESNINDDKKISLKKDFTQDKLNENYFFKQKTIDDYEGF